MVELGSPRLASPGTESAGFEVLPAAGAARPPVSIQVRPPLSADDVQVLAMMAVPAALALLIVLSALAVSTIRNLRLARLEKRAIFI